MTLTLYQKKLKFAQYLNFDRVAPAIIKLGIFKFNYQFKQFIKGGHLNNLCECSNPITVKREKVKLCRSCGCKI